MPPKHNRDPMGVCRYCRGIHHFYTSNCLFFTHVLSIHEDYTLNLQNYTEGKYTQLVPFKGHKTRKMEVRIDQTVRRLKFSYKSLYFKALTSPVFSEVGVRRAIEITAWRYQRLPGSELCYKLSSTVDKVHGYKVQPVRDFRLKSMKDYPWFNTTQQKYKYPAGPLNHLVCVKYCLVGLYYDFDS